MNDVHEILEWMRRSFVVDPIAGTLTWVRAPKNHPRLQKRNAGTKRKTLSGKVYVVVKRDGRGLKRGRLMYLWVHGRWPTPCVDHIDGNSLNDAINNLREATVTENAWNHKRRTRKSKLPMGVRSMASGRYQARVAFKKQMLHLGSFSTPEEAEAAYRSKRKELYREFA